MISITYELRISLYDCREGGEMRPLFATNTPEFTNLLEDFKKQVIYNNRTHSLLNRAQLEPGERDDHFLVENYGLFRIHEENLAFSYFDNTMRSDVIPTIFEGILRVELLLENLDFNENLNLINIDQEFVEILIWNSFNPTFNFTSRLLGFTNNYTRQHANDYLGTFVQVMDTPENVVFSIRAMTHVLK